MTSLVNKSADWPPNYHKIQFFFPITSLKCLRAARIDELADSNESAKMEKILEKSGNFVSLGKWEPWQAIIKGLIYLILPYLIADDPGAE